jgi:hypothetical protein
LLPKKGQNFKQRIVPVCPAIISHIIFYENNILT